MTIPKAAIEKAIEEGWKPDHKAQMMHLNEGEGFYNTIQVGDHIALDPTFWQALGKALGLSEAHGENEYFCRHWSHRAHEFYDLILTGGDTERFWAEILQ